MRGLLEDRERAARVVAEELRAEAERILAELDEAEMVLERRVIAVEELVEALAVPEEAEDAPATDAAGQNSASLVAGKAPVAGSMVPQWREGMTAASLSPEYRKIVELLESEARLDRDGEGMQAKEIAARLGLELVPAKIEGVRSRARRLAGRDWVERTSAGWFRQRTS
jgi:hypothetical protein